MGGKGSKLKLRPGDTVSSYKAKEVWEAYYSADTGAVDEAAARRFLHDFRQKMKLSEEYEKQFDALIERCSVRGPEGRLFDLEAFRNLLRSAVADAPLELSESMTIPSGPPLPSHPVASIPLPTQKVQKPKKERENPQRRCAMVRPEKRLPKPKERVQRRCAMVRKKPRPIDISPVQCAMVCERPEARLPSTILEPTAASSSSSDEDSFPPLAVPLEWEEEDIQCAMVCPDMEPVSSLPELKLEIEEDIQCAMVCPDAYIEEAERKLPDPLVTPSLPERKVPRRDEKQCKVVPRSRHGKKAKRVSLLDKLKSLRQKKPPQEVDVVVMAEVPLDMYLENLEKSERRERRERRCKVLPRNLHRLDSSDPEHLLSSSIDSVLLRSSVENPDTASKVVFSVDLISSCEKLLTGIAEFGRREELLTPEALQSSLMRYEFFLALFSEVVAEEGEEAALLLVPPVDVAHVWRAHLIRPLVYRRDCEEIFGAQISPAVLFADYAGGQREAAVNATEEKWNALAAKVQVPDMPYTPTIVGDGLPEPEISIAVVHLTEDILWWTNFNRHWGEEYEEDRREFLERRQIGYKEFLANGAAKMLESIENPCADVDMRGPHVDVDLFWHCHMMFPQQYDHDLQSQLGCLFYHRPQADPECQ